MNKIYIAALILALVFIGSYFFHKADKNEMVSTTSTYSNPNLGIEFTYKVGSNGYVIREILAPDSAQDLKGTIVLMRTEDALREMPVGGEGPATITIQVVKNSKNQEPEVWAESHNIYSNVNLKLGDTSEYVLGTVKAVRYAATGLYESDNVVAIFGENVYVFTGNYMDAESELRKDFISILGSIKFIP